MKSYAELVDSRASETDIRRYLVEGERVSVTMRIPDTLRDAVKAAGVFDAFRAGEIAKCFEGSNRLQEQIKKNLEVIGYGL